MSRFAKLGIIGAAIYLTASFIFGHFASGFRQHYITNIPNGTKEYARAWGMDILENVVSLSEQGTHPAIRVSNDWMEYGYFCDLMLSYLPTPHLQFASRYSICLSERKLAAKVHFDIIAPQAFEVRISESAGCWYAVTPTAHGCAIAFANSESATYRGYLATREGQEIEGSNFEIRVSWPSAQR